MFELANVRPAEHVILGENMPNGTIIDTMILDQLLHISTVDAVVVYHRHSLRRVHQGARIAPLRSIPENISTVGRIDHFIPLSF